MTPDAIWHVAHPIHDLRGPDAVRRPFLGPLHAAMPGLMRRGELVLGNRSRVSPGDWVATLGHYVGNFAAPLWGVQPHGKLVFLRCGEFYRTDLRAYDPETFHSAGQTGDGGYWHRDMLWYTAPAGSAPTSHSPASIATIACRS